MRDYYVISLDKIGGEVTISRKALDIKDIPWASKQLWAPDAAYKDGTYFLYFPAKDHNGIFRIGVAKSTSPDGPFKAQSQPIDGAFSIDPAIFEVDDGSHYMYFGGIAGGQLQYWKNGKFDKRDAVVEKDEVALTPFVAKLADNMTEFAAPARKIQIIDKLGNPLLAADINRRFFEAAWLHKKNDVYYLSYSTGDTHYLVYATSDNPYGPFTYQGRVLEPVEGWTTHHSIIEINSKTYLFYHDTQISGETHLRNVKVTEIIYDQDGKLKTVHPMKN